MSLSINSVTLSMDLQWEDKNSWFEVFEQISSVNEGLMRDPNEFSISSNHRVSQPFAVWVWIGEVFDSNVSFSSCWYFVVNMLWPCILFWICNHVVFVVTTLDLDCGWEILVVRSTIDTVTLSMDAHIESQSTWFEQISLVRYCPDLISSPFSYR
jgi:hypothetical protein